MLFNSFAFAAFLAVLLPLYYSMRVRAQNWLLLAGSYFFYGWWDWRFTGLLALSTIVDYRVGLAMGRSEDAIVRKRLLWLSLGVNLGILGFFKYCNFFVGSAASLLTSIGVNPNLPVLQIVLPVGISFYTFQTIAYSYSVYRRSVEPTRDLLNFAIYVAYFPQLVAGPIERSENLLPQIEAPRRVCNEQLHSGAQLILMGLFKKVAIADAIAPLVDSAFVSPGSMSSTELVLCIWLFAAQIYCDFSGYTDVARGVSRLLGIELMLNFRQPYLATNITDFWRRWHISLSSWLREHVYIPLGGNRRGTFLTYRNLMLTMLIGGLWHGAGWTFVVWGGLHGVYLAVHKWSLSRRGLSPADAARERGSRPFRWFATFATFQLVCLTWIFFRAPDFATAWTYLEGLLTFSRGVDGKLVVTALFYLPLVWFLDRSCWTHQRELPFDASTPWYVRGLAHAACVLLMLYVGTSDVIPFLYFQF